MSGVPYTFASATSSIPLSELDSNFATPVTIGTTSVTLGNTVTTLANVSLSNVTISSVASVIPNNFVANSSVIVNGTSNVAIASANGAVTMVTNGNTAVTIDTAQNVGIGVTSSSPFTNANTIGRLVVQQNSGAVNIVLVNNTNDAYTYLINDGTAFKIQNSYNSTAGFKPITFSASGSENMRIDTSGNLLVGQTSASQTTVGFFAKPNGEVSGCQSASTNGGGTQWNTYSTGAGAFRFYVGMGGTVFATSTTISGISDQRLKENIRDLDDGLDVVMALKPRKFDWKEGKGADIKNARGFIAQEFEEVFPDLIDEWQDPAPEGEAPYKSVCQDLIPVLVKAIQEQQALITAQQSTIQSLTERITALENK